MVKGKLPVVRINGIVEQKHLEGTLKKVAGSRSDEFNDLVIGSTVDSYWEGGINYQNDPDEYVKQKEKLVRASTVAMCDIAPQDVIEGMLASLMISSYNSVTECYRRAMLPSQTLEGRAMNLNQAEKLSRSYVSLLDALNKHRGKGQQKVTVEHVHVHNGGQAVVGVIEGGGVKANQEGQPHEKPVADASIEAMQCEDETRDAVPVASDAERSVQNTRRSKPRRAKG